MRVKMIVANWGGERTGTITAQLGCHIQTVRKRLARFDNEGLDGLSDLPRAGRKRRISELERDLITALAPTRAPSGRKRAGRTVAVGSPTRSSDPASAALSQG